MQLPYPILDAISALDGPAVEEALLRAVDDSGPEDQGVLVELVLERGTGRGLVGLVARYHALPPGEQDRLAARIGQLAPVLRATLRARTRQTRLNTLRLVCRTLQPSLAFLPVLALVDEDGEISRAAGDCLNAYVDWYLTADRPDEPTERSTEEQRSRYARWREDRDHLLDALRSALANFDSHGRSDLLGQMIRMGDDLADVLRPRLAEPGGQAGRALVEEAARHADPSVAPFLYLMLSEPEVRARAAGRISLLRERPLLCALWAQADRLSAPAVARGVQTIKRMVFFETPGWWEQVPDRLASGLVEWIGHVGVDGATRAQWLTSLAIDGSVPQRLAAMERLCAWEDEASTAALKRLMDHREQHVAEQAASELIRRGGEDLNRLMVSRLGDPNEKVRELATEHVGHFTFERFWTQFPQMTEEAREFAARKLRRVVGDLVEKLRVRLADPDAGQRLQAVRVADICRLAEPLADALLAASRDSDAKVRSAVVKLLGQAPGEASERAIVEALDDSDRRVRANAVEALEMLHAESCTDWILQMVEDADNRVRANAIKAMMGMNYATARTNLHEMLADRSPEHRLSALWVVEQIQWFKTATIVIRLARSDPDRRVRRRALRTLSELRQAYREARLSARTEKLARMNAGVNGG
ncbi:MAG: hypothetical protein BIFFINMI_01392 [Phycisphaerae bacterium]|nr:hypothetical protein [Phycisphaerae bacterium]